MRFRNLRAWLNQHRPDVLAQTIRAMKLGDQMDWNDALIAAEFPGVAFKVDIVGVVAFEAKGKNPEARIYHRADGRVPRRVEFFDQGVALEMNTTDRMCRLR